jgi:hypothetical protein
MNGDPIERACAFPNFHITQTSKGKEKGKASRTLPASVKRAADSVRIVPFDKDMALKDGVTLLDAVRQLFEEGRRMQYTRPLLVSSPLLPSLLLSSPP